MADRQQRSVRLDPELWYRVDRRRVELRLPSANAYIESLIRKDLGMHGDDYIVADTAKEEPK